MVFESIFGKCRSKIFLLTGLLLCVTSCATQRLTSEFLIPKQDSPQDYFAVFVNGQKVGYSVKSRAVESDEVISISSEVMKLNRFGTTVEMERYTKHIESLDGQPKSFEYIEKQVSKFWFFTDNKSKRISGVKKEDAVLEVAKTINGKTIQSEIKWPRGLLLSEGCRLLVKRTGLKEGKKFSLKEIFEYDPFDICDEECTVGQTKNINLQHNTVPLTEIFISVSSPRYGKISMVGCVDADCNIKKIVTTIGGFKVEYISCSREFAMRKTELLDPTDLAVIKCPVRLRNPGKAKQIRYHLIPTGNIELEFPASDNQSVERGESGSLFVSVHPVKAADGISFPYQGNDKTAQEALKPTEILQCDDEKIIFLARKAVGNTNDAAKAARKIEAFVNGYMQVGGSSAFDSAVEAAEERKGDCTEYAVLLAALCRAVGIPARVQLGHTYIDYFNGKWHVFVPHAWTEVYIGDKWVGLDATKNRFFGLSNSFSAGYIALSGIGDAPKMSDFGKLNTFKIQHIQQ